jgi:hypothetical protein
VRKHPKDILLFWEDTSLTLGRTKRGRNEVGDAVPSEARDALLMLSRTKEGLLGWTDGVERDCHPEHSEGAHMWLSSLRSG